MPSYPALHARQARLEVQQANPVRADRDARLPRARLVDGREHLRGCLRAEIPARRRRVLCDDAFDFSDLRGAAHRQTLRGWFSVSIAIATVGLARSAAIRAAGCRMPMAGPATYV